MPTALDAVTLHLALRDEPDLSTARLGLAPRCVVPSRCHAYEKRSAFRQLPRRQARVLPERVKLGRLVFTGKAVGLAVRQNVP